MVAYSYTYNPIWTYDRSANYITLSNTWWQTAGTALPSQWTYSYDLGAPSLNLGDALQRLKSFNELRQPMGT